MILFVLEVLVNPIQTVFAGDRHWRSLDDVWNGFLDLDECQCPLGLIPHFHTVAISRLYSTLSRVSMPSQAYTSFLPGQVRVDPETGEKVCVNALSGLYIISTVPLQKPRFYAVSRACFCRYLSEYSDNSRFSCMLTFWTYLMRCTYP